MSRSPRQTLKGPARTYPTTTAEGERLNIWAICKAFGISDTCFYRHAKKARLASKDMAFEVRFSGKWKGASTIPRKEKTWLKSEAEAALQPRPFPRHVAEGRWIDLCTFEPADSESDTRYYTEKGIQDHTDNLAKRAGRTARRRRKSRLLGRPVDKLKVTSPIDPKRKIYVYRSKDTTEMDQAAVTKAADYCAKTEGYGTRRELKAEFGVSDGFFGYWTERPTTLRRNDSLPALRWTTEPHSIGGRGGGEDVDVFCREDVINIRAGKETDPHYLGAGQPSHPNLSKKARDRKAERFLRDLLKRNGPMLVHEIRAQAAKEGINPAVSRNGQTVLDRAKRKLRVKIRRKFGPPGGSPAYWYLPKQRPPAVLSRHQGEANAIEHSPQAGQTGPQAENDQAGPHRRGRVEESLGAGRGRPRATERHKRWKAQHDAGKSLGQIAKAFKVTRRAVVKAIRALGN